MSLKSWSGQVLYCGGRRQTVTVPAILVRIGLSEWNLSNQLHFRKCLIKILFTKRCAPVGMAGRTSTKWRLRFAPLIFLPGFPSDAVHNVHSHKTRKWHAVCFFWNYSKQTILPQHRFARPNGADILLSCVGIPWKHSQERYELLQQINTRYLKFVVIVFAF